MSLDPVTAILDIGNTLINKIFPDPAQAANAKLELLKLQQTGELAQLTANTDLAKGQMAINQIEAANNNMFVAGWRPFIGWVCGSALAYDTIVQPLGIFLAKLAGKTLDLPALPDGLLQTVLFAILGMGAMRTVEKVQGVKQTDAPIKKPAVS